MAGLAALTRFNRRRAGGLTLGIGAGAHAVPGGLLAASPTAALAHARSQAEATLAGLLVTAAATAEDPHAHGGTALLVQLTLENATGGDISGVHVQVPIPAGTRIESSWHGAHGERPGEVRGQTVAWTGLALRSGERLAPTTLRLAPAGGADGAVVFRDAAVRPEITWSAPSAGRASPSSLPLNGLWGDGGLRRTVLPTGLTVLTRERPDTDTVSLMMGVRAGARDEDDATHGGSHWLEHAHFLGTARRPGGRPEIGGAIERVGGAMNATTSSESTRYFATVPAEEFGVALDVLSDQLLNSTFPHEAFERERAVVFEELKTADDNPATRASREFLRLVFRASPLRRDAGGTIDTVRSIPIVAILAHRDRHYVAGNMAFAAVGNLQHGDAVAQIERAFAGLSRGPRTPRPPVQEPVQTEPRRLLLGEGERRAEVRLGWPVPGRNDAEWAPLVILQDVLGATGRRLTEEIRDRRAIATSVGPTYAAYSDAGYFAVAATTQPDRVDQVISLVLAEIERVHLGQVTGDDLETSVRAIAGRRALGDELNEAQAARVSSEVSGVLESTAEFLARLRAVRPADVQRAAQTYLNLASYTLVVVRS